MLIGFAQAEAPQLGIGRNNETTIVINESQYIYYFFKVLYYYIILSVLLSSHERLPVKRATLSIIPESTKEIIIK